ncbi:nucleotidyltransferase [Pelagicoccus sp. NFK12]|uniref:Nucleotidyltransferase n=1 Tax=Pelagicoccus enzymogenes TaxID=2773457 RepID=A0A927FC17_9BACT|nr:nucleotidyltransferase [Pelagicoccus enzymogenes]MBD5780950.1 nucleotidyltransferase [Pelagicoccus enzymogenes]
MELYREFFSIIEKLNEHGLDYSVVGGIALAFHDTPRFTRDIDILAKPADLEKYEGIFQKLGYHKTSEPWSFGSTQLTMHRFGKKSEEDEEELVVIDLLIGHESRHHEIIDASIIDDSPAGKVRLAQREDLIWMKKLRGSKQDEADIENLESKND